MAAYSAEETETLPPEVPVPKGGGGGGGRAGPPTLPKNVTKKVLLELDAPLSQTLFAGDEKTVLVTLKNKGDLALPNISLDSKTNAPRVGLSLSEDFFEILSVDAEDNVLLKIKSLVEPIAHIGINNYFVTVTAYVPSFEYQTSFRFFINLIEKSYEARLETQKQLKFAENLLEENPECSEFYKLIKQAKEHYSVSEYNKSLSLIDSAIQACRDKIGIEEEVEELAPEEKENILLLLIEIIILLILLSAMLYYYKKRRGKKTKVESFREIPGYYESPLKEKIKSDLESRFKDLCKETEKFIKNEDIVNARKGYLRLHSLYKIISNSSLPHSRKSEYYRRLLAIHSELSRITKR